MIVATAPAPHFTRTELRQGGGVAAVCCCGWERPATNERHAYTLRTDHAEEVARG